MQKWFDFVLHACFIRWARRATRPSILSCLFQERGRPVKPVLACQAFLRFGTFPGRLGSLILQLAKAIDGGCVLHVRRWASHGVLWRVRW
jgi:hypothetical protein